MSAAPDAAPRGSSRSGVSSTCSSRTWRALRFDYLKQHYRDVTGGGWKAGLLQKLPTQSTIRPERRCPEQSLFAAGQLGRDKLQAEKKKHKHTHTRTHTHTHRTHGTHAREHAHARAHAHLHAHAHTHTPTRAHTHTLAKLFGGSNSYGSWKLTDFSEAPNLFRCVVYTFACKFASR